MNFNPDKQNSTPKQKEESVRNFRPFTIWALLRQNLSLGFANNIGTDQPVYPQTGQRLCCLHFGIIMSKLDSGEI